MNLLLVLQNYQLLACPLFLGGNLTQGFDLVAKGFRKEYQANELEKETESALNIFCLFLSKSSF